MEMLFVASVIDEKEKVTNLTMKKSIKSLIDGYSNCDDEKDILLKALKSFKSDDDYFRFLIALNAAKIAFFKDEFKDIIPPIKNDVESFIDLLSGNLEKKISSDVDPSIHLDERDLIYPKFVSSMVEEALNNNIDIDEAIKFIKNTNKDAYEAIKFILKLNLDKFSNMEFYEDKLKLLDELKIDCFNENLDNTKDNKILISIISILEKF